MKLFWLCMETMHEKQIFWRFSISDWLQYTELYKIDFTKITKKYWTLNHSEIDSMAMPETNDNNNQCESLISVKCTENWTQFFRKCPRVYEAIIWFKVHFHADDLSSIEWVLLVNISFHATKHSCESKQLNIAFDRVFYVFKWTLCAD